MWVRPGHVVPTSQATLAATVSMTCMEISCFFVARNVVRNIDLGVVKSTVFLDIKKVLCTVNPDRIFPPRLQVGLFLAMAILGRALGRAKYTIHTLAHERLLEISCARVCISSAPQSPSPKSETTRSLSLT